MTTHLDQTDAVAGSLANAYQVQGEFCIVIRTSKAAKGLRLIYPQADVTIVSELLRMAADQLFDGTATVKH